MDINQLKTRFAEEFGGHQDVRLFFAPGRVNLIGEHTDYNGGYVFPAALTYGTWALVTPRQDGKLRFVSTHFNVKAECSLDQLVYVKEEDWANYPKGVISKLLTYPSISSSLRGADILYYGNIPNGAGLSSSASIELVTALAISRLVNSDIPMIELVQLSQQAENQFVGVNCGIMDQFAVGMGKKDHAMLLKCDTLQYDYVPFQANGYKLVITNTNKRRGLADSKYNERRSECEQGLLQIQKVLPYILSLGDLRYAEWEQVRGVIQSDVIRNRVEHVVSENERVLLATRSLKENDLISFGQYMLQSHESLRDLYEVTGLELDTLFEEAAKVPGCVGTRMTGAGFGGCNVSLVREEAVEEFKKRVAENYTLRTGFIPDFYVCEVGDGAKEITGL
ncbi:galactokinase [Ammoniphilus sp. YIM 78166]|uniref:galactokinase n=1 Tax=Ammoniphilus sp. YIM 78166 TaxID=1644106 RepID=UPI0010705616|nr:galactokinase [Ammoniphilus sp. YIM 78166]